MYRHNAVLNSVALTVELSGPVGSASMKCYVTLSFPNCLKTMLQEQERHIHHQQGIRIRGGVEHKGSTPLTTLLPNAFTFIVPAAQA